MTRRTAILALVALPVAPASAQTRVEGTATLTTDDLFRGRSQSNGRPVGRATVSVDLPQGVYGGLSASAVVAGDGGIGLNGLEQYAGYARQLGPRRTLDVGIVNAVYTGYASGGGARRYTAIHAGLLAPGFAVRVNLSPDYFERRRAAIYGEVDAILLRHRGWDLGIHAGLLAQDTSRRAATAGRYDNGYDWRIGIGRSLGRYRIDGAIVGRGPDAPASRALVSLTASF